MWVTPCSAISMICRAARSASYMSRSPPTRMRPVTTLTLAEVNLGRVSDDMVLLLIQRRRFGAAASWDAAWDEHWTKEPKPRNCRRSLIAWAQAYEKEHCGCLLYTSDAAD